MLTVSATQVIEIFFYKNKAFILDKPEDNLLINLLTKVQVNSTPVVILCIVKSSDGHFLVHNLKSCYHFTCTVHHSLCYVYLSAKSFFFLKTQKVFTIKEIIN